MIIIRLKGGPGNQLFQYAAARSLAHIHNTTVKLDTTSYYYGGPRQFELCHFNIQVNLATVSDIKNLIEVKQNKLQKILHSCFHSHPKLSPNHVRYNKSQYNPDFHKLPDNIYLEGYFESEKYFINIADIIRDEYRVKNELTGKNKEVAEKIQNTQSVGICVRRGDYVADPKINRTHGICSLDYYYHCIEQIHQKIKEPFFFVFSDDIDWCKNNLKINYPVAFVDHNGIDKAYENLRLISFCKHHIMANSSFSWWGVWLSTNRDKIVFAPQKWFVDKKFNIDDILPAGWIKK